MTSADPPPSPRPSAMRFDRRTFIIGSAAVGLLAACGSDPDPFAVVQRFPSDAFVPGEIRLPFGIARSAEFITDGPDQLKAKIFDLDGKAVGGTITANRRDITPFPYYAFRTTIDTPGIYSIVIDGGPEEGANFQVLERDAVLIPRPGDVLAGFDTPTVGEPRGVDPICTREPECPFHSVTLSEALATGKAVGYFVGTPAFCQTGSCAPALETLITAAADVADDFVFVHAEVWTDLTATTPTPAVDALGLTFEPTMFIVGSDGVIVERLDGLWDATEVVERLAAALS